jgi:hypothetical protein
MADAPVKNPSQDIKKNPLQRVFCMKPSRGAGWKIIF